MKQTALHRLFLCSEWTPSFYESVVRLHRQKLFPLPRHVQILNCKIPVSQKKDFLKGFLLGIVLGSSAVQTTVAGSPRVPEEPHPWMSTVTSSNTLVAQVH